jgi:large subunit ribosomal protein L21
MTYAVIQTGGKQYMATPGDTITIEKIGRTGKAVGEKVVFDNVLLVDNGTEAKIGTPMVVGAQVEGTVVEAGRARKVTVIHFKSKARERKKAGHRQPFLKVKIDAIK